MRPKRLGVLLAVLLVVVVAASAMAQSKAPAAPASPPAAGQATELVEHASMGRQLATAASMLTGTAINPLFGVTVRSLWMYWEAPATRRPSLPWYASPWVWAPGLLIMLLMLTKGTLIELAPPIKIPLTALGDVVAKGGALFALPIVLSAFANAFAPPAAQATAQLYNAVVPLAYASETGAAVGGAAVGVAGGAAVAGGVFLVVGWLLSLTIGLLVYAVVFVAANTFDVLILISPFPGVDAVLKSLRLALVGALFTALHIHPVLGLLASLGVIALSVYVAGWSLRLSWFGWVYSTDILLFRNRTLDAVENGVAAFSNKGITHLVPMRTWGVVWRTVDERLEFHYRPWLLLPRRRVELPGEARDYELGKGLLNPYVVYPRDDGKHTTLFRLPPRFKRHEGAVARCLTLAGVRDVSILRGFRALWQHIRNALTRKRESDVLA